MSTHCSLVFHVVFSTKLRRQFLDEQVDLELYRYFAGILQNKDGLLLEGNGWTDHVHLLLKLKPKHCLSDIVRDLKANASGWIKERFPALRSFGWQDGFSAFTVSQSQIARVRGYISRQKEHHKRRDYRSELEVLLRKHEVEFDEQLLWRT